MKKNELICLGAIVGVHGIKGEVKIKSFTEKERDIEKYGELQSEDGSKKLSLKVTGHSKELLRAKVKGVEDRDAAEALIGTGLYVRRELLPETKEEEFYYNDLIGLEVKQQGSEDVIGEVNGVYNFGAGDLLEVKMKETNALEVLPFTKQYVPTINITDGYIIVEMIHYDSAEGDEDHEG